MFIKLASRNVKRQVRNYLIYFITVTLTIALMFAMNNVIYSKEMQNYAATSDTISQMLTVISVFVSIIVSFVLGYATSFMLKLRKREFGTYLTLGMTRGNILLIFILETLILCFAALLCGIALGLFIFQGMMLIVTHIMEMEISFASYSPDGLLLTIVLVSAVFLLSSAASAVYLKRVSIHHLIHGEKRVSKRVKYPVIWLIITVLSFIGILFSLLLFDHGMRIASTDTTGIAEKEMMYALLIIAIAIVLFHIGLSKSLAGMLLRNKKFCSTGTNTFTLGQLSASLGSNSVLAGVLAFLIAFSIIGANISFVMKTSEEISLDAGYPFDAEACFSGSKTPAISLDTGREVIEKYNEILWEYPYTVYTEGTYLNDFIGTSYGTDYFMKASEFNALLTAKGYEPLDLKNTFFISANSVTISGHDFSGAVLERNGISCSFGGMTTEYPNFTYGAFVAVVPDKFAEGMAVECRYTVFDLKHDKYDVYAMRDELTYEYIMDELALSSGNEVYSYSFSNDGTFSMEMSDFSLREFARMERNANAAALILGMLYMATIFVLLSMAILALKTLAGLSEDKERYRILFRLGAGEKEQSRTLLRQTFTFFFLPFAVPFLLTFPTALLCGKLMDVVGYPSHAGEVYFCAVMITLVISVIYLLYFTATYLIARRNVVYSVDS